MFKMLSLAAIILALSACVPMRDIPEWEELAFWKRKKPVKVVQYDPEEHWCYKTLAAIDCYKTPQHTSPERLVGVEPRTKRPLTRQEHGQALLDAAKSKP